MNTKVRERKETGEIRKEKREITENYNPKKKNGKHGIRSIERKRETTCRQQSIKVVKKIIKNYLGMYYT